MHRLLWILSFALLFSQPSWALSTYPQSDTELTVRLISESDSLGTEPKIKLGLDVSLAEGVHTYWRSPGAAGSPPRLDWSQSENLQNATLLYPMPMRKAVLGMDSLGYENHVVFPIHAWIKDGSKPLSLKLALDILVCKDLCLPKHFDLNLTLPTGQGGASPEASLIKNAMDTVPTPTPSPALAITNLIRTENKVYVEITSDDDILSPDMFVETRNKLAFLKPDVSINPSRHKAMLVSELDGTMPTGQSLAQTPLTLTITNGGTALEQQLTEDGPPVTQSTAPAKKSPSPQSEEIQKNVLPLWNIILFALMGGLILNLMPCVLPVLSLKVFSVLKHGGNARHHIRRSFLSTGCGIVFSFIILATITILLKMGGTTIGWGMQFQQPTFLVFMISLLTLFAANLWGFFELTLPRFIMDSVDTTHHPKLAGDFATGMLATLLATPCSAPFLGTAIGFALAAGPVEILCVFTGLGVGMAMPYLCVAIWPQIAGALPKPGNWMTSLTRLLGFGMAGTALWLLFVLHEQIGVPMTSVIAIGMLLLLAQLFLRHKKILRVLTIPVLVLVFVGSCAIGLVATVPEQLSRQAGLWQKFDEDSINRAVREGKVVFVDITADWCLTCKANKRFTLSQEDVANRIFNNDKIIVMQGDWTNPDPAITAFLHKHGRYGIPFNAVFGPQTPNGILLPELLTPSIVLEAINHAESPSHACPVDLPAGKNC
ncbi:MAG: protein-disulfide reductase DsbD family protein [Alphaproteobacteria bacterium]|nr:protein-disulfide reductase DsbD family protein [Alphaproteobacteria bacterium]